MVPQILLHVPIVFCTTCADCAVPVALEFMHLAIDAGDLRLTEQPGDLVTERYPNNADKHANCGRRSQQLIGLKDRREYRVDLINHADHERGNDWQIVGSPGVTTQGD